MAKHTTKRNRCTRDKAKRISKQKSHSSTYVGCRNYSRYINRVLKEVIPQNGISSHTVDILNTLLNDIFEYISTEACNLMFHRDRCTLTPEDVQKAVYLLLPGKLAKYAVTFGSDAVCRYIHS
ncbi:histone H2B subacrosomal variant-like [Sorex fumeus]|uniref:histone H2B subacrosomal variant-like n=1 Tax=Sorex fumeus TaxID=62283 RepID=UPI0024ADB54F|nr:histone H2B subacrosomal variant-like [Sorex fumeus]